MKKSMRKVILLLLTLMLTLVITVLPVFAQEKSGSDNDGLTVSITTDKSSYKASDKIQVTLEVTNNGSKDIEHVTLESIVPKGYAVEKGAGTIKDIGTLKRGDKASLTVTLIKTNSSLIDNLPKTGDTTKTLILAGILAVAVIALIVCIILIMKDRKNGKGLFSLFLAFAMLLSLMPAIGGEEVQAASSLKTITVTTAITVDNNPLVLYGNVHYQPASEETVVSLSNMSAEPGHIEIGLNTIVHFSVKVNGNPESVDICRADGTKVGTMNDNGTDGDITAKDGIYSVNLTLYSEYVQNIEYYASCQGARSNNVKITYFEKKDPEPAKGGAVEGVIYGSDTHKPIRSAVVSIYKENERINQAIITDAENGKYHMDLPAGKYTMIAVAEGYVSAEATIVITDNQVLHMEDLYMSLYDINTTGNIAGNIQEATTGKPIEGAAITVRKGWNNQNDGEPVYSTSSADDGSYLVILPAGNYTVSVTKDGYVKSFMNVNIANGVTQEGCNIALNSSAADNEYTIILTWGQNPRDLDAHMIGTKNDGKRFHVFFSSKSVSEDGKTICELTNDENKGFGPETIILNPNNDKPYYFYVEKQGGDGSVAESKAEVRIYKGSEIVATLQVPSDGGDANVWNVFAMVDGKIVVKNSITSKCDVQYADHTEETTSEETTAEETTEATTEEVTTAEETTEATTEEVTTTEETTEATTEEETTTEETTTEETTTEETTTEETTTEETTTEETTTEETTVTTEAETTTTEEVVTELIVTEDPEVLDDGSAWDQSDEYAYAGELEQIQSSGVMRVGVKGEENIDENGNYIGSGADLLYSFAQRIGVQVDIIVFTSSDTEDQMVRLLEDNQISMIWSGLTTNSMGSNMGYNMVYYNGLSTSVIGSENGEEFKYGSYDDSLNNYFIGFHYHSDLMDAMVSFLN